MADMPVDELPPSTRSKIRKTLDRFIPNFEGNWSVMLNILMTALVISLIFMFFSSHGGYGLLLIIGTVVSSVFWFVTLLSDKKGEEWLPEWQDTEKRTLFVCLAGALGAVPFALWYVISWEVGISSLAFAIAIVLIFRLGLASVTQGAYTMVTLAVCGLLLFAGTSIPGYRVAETTDNVYSYSEKAIPFALLFGEYKTYYNLSSGKVSFAELPTGWSGYGNFEFTQLGELSSDDFKNLLTDSSNASGTMTIDYTVPANMQLQTATEAVAALEQQLADAYPQVDVAVTMTYTETATSE